MAKGFVVVIFAIILSSANVYAQPAQSDASTEPIAASSVVATAESTLDELRNIDKSATADPDVAVVAADLPQTRDAIDAQRAVAADLVRGHPALDALREAEERWRTFNQTLAGWNEKLTARAALLDKDLERLNALDAEWRRTQDSAGTADLPPEVAARIPSTLAAVQAARDRTNQARSRLSDLQNQIAVQQSRVAETRDSLRRARDEAVGNLLVKDSPALWSGASYWSSTATLASDVEHSLGTQIGALREYIDVHRLAVVVHAGVFACFAFALFWARARVRVWVEREPALARAATVFRLPIATALLLSVVSSGWIYPEAPRLLRAILGAVALVPTVFIVRRLIDRPLYALLDALVGFYVLDQFRLIVQALPMAARLVDLFEFTVVIVFVSWYILKPAHGDESEAEDARIHWASRFASYVALAIFLVACAANAFGYVAFARLIGGGVLGSAYFAVVLYAAVKIVDGFVMFALRVPPLGSLPAVAENRGLLRARIVGTVKVASAALWLLVAMELTAIRVAVIGWLRGALAAQLTLGAIAISLGDVLGFITVIGLAAMVSRLVRFVLREEVFPRTGLNKGVPYAITTLIHYAILFVGFLVALGAIGVDMTRFTILAGAFGVGLGFGLQNIVNNFVSGVILLFERPVNVGDTVQIGAHLGDLRRIGLRASVIRTPDGSEVVVPNGDLISKEVVNLAIPGERRRIDIRLGVDYEADPEEVLSLLKGAAEAHTMVLKDPAPTAFFLGFGDSTLDFQLLAWTNRTDLWAATKSEVTVAVNRALREAGVAIPGPRREIHVRTVDRDAAKVLARNSFGKRNGEAEGPDHPR